MSETHVVTTEYWERAVKIRNKTASIRAEIEQEVETGRAEIGYLLKRYADIDKLNLELKELRKEIESADDGESDIPTIPPPKPTSV